MPDPATPNSSVDRLIAALRAHAALITATTDPTVVLPAVTEVRSAAREYADTVYAATGWGNVFADIFADEDDDDDDGVQFVVEGEVDRLSITGRWDFLVRDAQVLQDFAAARLTEASPDIGPEDLDSRSGDPSAALESLVSEDIGRYPGLEGAGGAWTVEHVGKTLFEMTPSERQETGF